mgnify:CR=1 FL=1
MSDEDYDTLLRIVEAEAGSEDIKGRVLVANVIMNRVKSEDFPNTVTEVVWDNSDGSFHRPMMAGSMKLQFLMKQGKRSSRR